MMANNPVHILIFTDLDGTLLDHSNYSAKPADGLVQSLNRSRMADVIPITSKTYSELQELQPTLNHEIGITENGSVIHARADSQFVTNGPAPITVGIRYVEILERIKKLPPSFRSHILGFANMSAEEVALETGLPLEEAKRAKAREATEPFLWSGTDAMLEEMTIELSQVGIKIQRGGRFYHCTGDAAKEQAMNHVVGSFIERYPDTKIISIALGDGPNDLKMIEAADIGVIMPNPDGVTITSTNPHVRTAPLPGPNGWVAATKAIFAELGFNLDKS